MWDKSEFLWRTCWGTHWELKGGNIVVTHWEPWKNEKKNPSPNFAQLISAPLCQVDNEEMQKMSKFDDSKNGCGLNCRAKGQ
jgi:hypothetical protein